MRSDLFMRSMIHCYRGLWYCIEIWRWLNIIRYESILVRFFARDLVRSDRFMRSVISLVSRVVVLHVKVRSDLFMRSESILVWSVLSRVVEVIWIYCMRFEGKPRVIWRWSTCVDETNPLWLISMGDDQHLYIRCTHSFFFLIHIYCSYIYFCSQVWITHRIYQRFSKVDLLQLIYRAFMSI